MFRFGAITITIPQLHNVLIHKEMYVLYFAYHADGIHINDSVN